MQAVARKVDVLIGRAAEAGHVAELMAAARDGRGGTLVVTGEAGIGKTALLEQAAGDDSGFLVVRAAGAEFEQEVPYAGLHQFCVPLLRYADGLPDRHREALHVAFGVGVGDPDPFRVGLAVLELTAAAARERPLLCLIDDSQWLDPASSLALAFLARRVAADPVVLLFAVRSPGPAGELGTLPQLAIGGLSDESARQLLGARSPVPLDERVRDRLVAEANGNPLALLELPRAGGFAPPATSSVPDRVEREFQARLADLPGDARLLLTLASADPTGDPRLLWRAARVLGVDVQQASAQAAAAGLAEFGTHIRFCHPMARSAIYRAADAVQRRAVHAALAQVTDAVVAPDRRAWHRAQAIAGPDDEVATDLERCATRAQARGGVAAAAAFLELSAVLTLDDGRRLERTLRAARAHFEAGSGAAAEALLTTVEPAALTDVQQADADLMRGRIAFTRPGDGTGPALMARGAQRLAPSDTGRARACYLDALETSLLVGRGGGFIPEILAAARSAPAPESPDVLSALMTLMAGEHRTAIPMLADLFRAGHGPMWNRWPSLATMISVELWEPDTVGVVAEWLVKAGRESGSPRQLRLGLAQKSVDATLSGDIGQALAAVAEEGAIADAGGEAPLTYPRLHLAAQRGRRQEFDELAAAARQAETADGTGQVTNLHWSAAVLHNGLGDYPAALAAAREATAPGRIFMAGASLPELIEAAVRCREPELAAAALAALTERTEAAGTVAGRGIAAYARGLVTGVEDHFREAVGCLAEGPMVPYLGRAHLLYGEWLRRQGRRRDATGRLRTAHDLLSGAGADGFAERAAAELRAAGERVDRRAEPTYDQLTLQELAVARLVASGETSHEVAVRLFISKRTVDAHLRNIFRKLEISSRRQLRDRPGLGTDTSAVCPALGTPSGSAADDRRGGVMSSPPSVRRQRAPPPYPLTPPSVLSRE